MKEARGFPSRLLPPQAMKSYTRTELACCDGKEGRPAWIAWRGKVYDVSESFLWKGGRHMAMHEAGQDLSDVLGEAPHGEDLLERVPVIGVLEKEAGRRS